MSTRTRSELTPQTGAKFLDRDSICAPAARIAAFLASTVQVRCTAFAARGTSRAAAAMHKLTFPQRPSSCCILLYVQTRCAAQRTQCALQQHCSHRTPSHALASTRPARILQHPRTQRARTGIRARSTQTRVSNSRALTRAHSRYSEPAAPAAQPCKVAAHHAFASRTPLCSQSPLCRKKHTSSCITPSTMGQASARLPPLLCFGAGSRTRAR